MFGRLGHVILASVVVCSMFTATDSASNCWLNSDCDGAPLGYFISVIDFEELKLIKVCCPFHSSVFFTAGSFPRPYCRCEFDLMKTKTCWKGEQCCDCTEVGLFDDMPVCCSDCRKALVDIGSGTKVSRLKYTNTTCSC